jgi:hypothetical protein
LAEAIQALHMAPIFKTSVNSNVNKNLSYFLRAPIIYNIEKMKKQQTFIKPQDILLLKIISLEDNTWNQKPLA